MDNSPEQPILPPSPEELKPETVIVPESAPEVTAPVEKRAEAAGTAINRTAQPVAGPPPLVLPPVVQPPQTSDNAAPAVGSTPTIADDVEVIEKEWVDKARQIVAETKDDPYRQEQAVGQLKRTYVKKRYNKDLKDSEN
jgi:hypothetical protein